MLKIAFIAIAVIVIAFLVVAALQSSDFRVVRKATFAAPPAAVFEHVNDLHKWNAWSPWAKMDPAMKQTFSGPQAGVGAVQEWQGNSKVGEGRMTIEDSRPNEVIRFKLEFFKPMAATNSAEFVFIPIGDKTEVTWSMDGEKNLMCKAMGLVMNMDKMIGEQFEQGLSSLKEIVETSPAKVTVN